MKKDKKDKKNKKKKNKTLQVSLLNLVYTSDPEKGRNLEIRLSTLHVVIIVASVILAFIFSVKKLIKTIKGLLKR